MPTTMEILRVEHEGCPELVITGRLDSYWARHVGEAVEELMREGIHDARLNLANTSYISSAGIRVLVQAFQQFAAVGGTLLVVEPSAAVRQILDLAGLGNMLCAPMAQEPARDKSIKWTREEDRCTFEAYHCAPGERLECKIAGHPEHLLSSGFDKSDCLTIRVPRDAISLGLGAFGDTYEECQDRFGEFVAVAGCAAYQPTDETGCADYILGAGTLLPHLATLYSLSCEGKFERFLRFDSHPQNGPVSLSNVLEICIEAAKTPVTGIVMLAESSGVLGASLKRSPTLPHEPLFHHPEVRQWLSFSPVRSYTRCVLLIAGVIAKHPCPPALLPLLRAVKHDSTLAGHLHAAVFGYRPLRKGYMELEPAVERLFDSGGLQCVLHLLADDRAGAGGGETELTRGACWIGPVAQIGSVEKHL